jgi:hypothetical protein
VTNGNVDLTCDMTQGGTKICHIEGATPGHLIDPPDARMVVTHSSGTRSTHVPPGSCPLGSGPLTSVRYTVTFTSANPPDITRRP